MRSTVYLLCCILLCSGQSLRAQQPQPDPIGESLFPPELVMQHQQTIGLSEDQKTFLKAEIRKAQTQFTELQWKLQDEMEKMALLVKQEQVDEQQVLAQLDKVLTFEREIKHTQIALLVRIKNHLTAEQRARLQEIKNKHQQR